METNVKRNFRSLASILVVMTMVFTSAVFTAFAADKADIIVQNVEDGATVTAYQIVKKGASGDWENVYNVIPATNPPTPAIADVTKLTAAEITALAKRTDLVNPITLTAGADGYKANVDPGMYLVLVSKTNSTKVYNPMIVSVNIDGENATSGSVDANGNFVEKGDNSPADDTIVYAKSSTPNLKKEIVGKPENTFVTGDNNTHGDTLKPGDVTNFKITTTIPSYSAQYNNDNLKFEIKDTVSAGLDQPHDIVVKNGEIILIKDTDYTLEWSGAGKTFTIKFKKEYLLSGNAAKEITVEYKARLNDNATSGFDANTNLAELTYSNSPSTVDDSKKDKTYHYTFDIDGDISGTLGKYGKEIIKVGVDASTGEFITAEEGSDLGSVEGKLKNVEFTLYKEDGITVVQGPINTDSNGLMKFSKLDAGKYVLKETNAPAGYILNNTAIPVEITAKLMDDGKLESYTVKINDEATSTYKATYNDENQLIAVNDQTGNQSAIIKNYKPGALPSTGGMGTYIFMIAGGALIALAAVLYIRNRKKHVA